jgi:hypothetical protein
MLGFRKIDIEDVDVSKPSYLCYILIYNYNDNSMGIHDGTMIGQN